jgi:urease accessory protein
VLAAHDTGWHARLCLEFAARGARTALVRRAHSGPLQVQRTFAPEADGTCHAYVLHPPGGVVGGDALEIDVTVRAGARSLITTPASGKFYRSGGAVATQHIGLRAEAGALLEWLPQDTIVFNGARVESRTRVDLSGDARFIGWDVVCLGRPASGETFTSGRLRQRIELWRDGVPLYLERADYDARAPVMSAAWGMAGQCVTGTLLATGGDAALLDAVRAACAPLSGAGAFAATLLRDNLVCRYLGPHAHEARRCLQRAWEVARPAVMNKPACAPRIWST